MEKLPPNPQFENSKDDNIKDEFKLENEKLKLSLRKNKINNIIFSKRKIIYNTENDEDVKKNYSININDIQIPNELIIDIPNFIKNVRLFFHFVLV